MHQVYKLNFKFFLIAFLLLGFVSGCKEKKETISLGEWINLIAEKANIPEATENNSYFLNVSESEEYFNSIQAGVEWGILSTEVSFDPKEKLNREWLAYTLTNLYGDTVSNQKITDLSKSQFPEHVASSVSLGIMKLDSRGCFNPKKVVDRNEAKEILNQMISYINKWSPNEDVIDIDYAQEIKSKDSSLLYFNIDDLIAIFDGIKHDFLIGDLLSINDNHEIYKIKAIVQDGGRTEVYLEQPQIDEVFDEINLESTFDVDFDDVEFDIDEDIEKEGSFSNPLFENVASKEFTVKDFNVKVESSQSSVSARISKNLNSGGVVASELKLFNFKPTIRLKMKGFSIEEAYVKFNYSTNSSLSFNKGKNKHLYSDFSFLDKGNLLSGLTSSFNNNLTHSSATITLGTISIPVHNVPTLTIKAKLQLYFYANGKIELSLSNDYEMGVEIKNSKLRFFSEQSKKSDFIIRASGGVIGGINLGLELLNTGLVDLSLQAGVRAKVESRVMYHDETDKVQGSNTSMSYDFLEEATTVNGGIKACGEISAHWVLDLVINSEKTIAAKMGLTYKKSLLNNQTASIIPKDKRYIENGKFVSSCFKDHMLFNDKNSFTSIESDKIILGSYNLIVEKGKNKSIVIQSLPGGYTIDDLTFDSSNEQVIQLINTHEVYGKEKGSARVIIKTKDNLYRVVCNIMVVNKDDN